MCLIWKCKRPSWKTFDLPYYLEKKWGHNGKIGTLATGKIQDIVDSFKIHEVFNNVGGSNGHLISVTMRRLGAHSCYTVWQTEKDRRKEFEKRIRIHFGLWPPPKKTAQQNVNCETLSQWAGWFLSFFTLFYILRHFALFKVWVLFLKGMISFFFQNQGNKTPMN